MLCLQIYSSEMKSTLTLSDLSPYDNGRLVVCSAENMVGQTEATLQLNILCKDFSVSADCKMLTSYSMRLISSHDLLNAVLKDFVISSGSTRLLSLLS